MTKPSLREEIEKRIAGSWLNTHARRDLVERFTVKQSEKFNKQMCRKLARQIIDDFTKELG